MSHAEILAPSVHFEVLKREIQHLRDELTIAQIKAQAYEEFYLATINKQGSDLRGKAERLRKARLKIDALNS